MVVTLGRGHMGLGILPTIGLAPQIEIRAENHHCYSL